ncbi:heme-binding protein [Rhodobacteraceae bacterium CH30]|nr:heme-binding protein [Rhodobacteraceae bacterium CH30]
MQHALAKQLISHAEAEALAQGFSINTAVVDASGLLLAFSRMDDALLGAIDVSIKKARTAALFRMDSDAIGAWAQPGGAIYTLEYTNGGLISFGGGVVVKDAEGKVLGAVGVAGATVDADADIARKAAQAAGSAA